MVEHADGSEESTIASRGFGTCLYTWWLNNENGKKRIEFQRYFLTTAFFFFSALPSFYTFTTSILRRPTTATSLSPSASISGQSPHNYSSTFSQFTHSTSTERMAQPSSSHHEERRHRSDRERERSSHHHRTISSTTLLLTLTLVLAVLAVMLSLPTRTSTDSSSGVMSYLTPKRNQALIARESAVALREAEVARREAELLAGAPGGVIPSPSPILCPSCVASTITLTETPPVQTIIKEIVKEDSLAPAGWGGPRAEEILERELKIAERERDISKREENVNRREHDASRREGWIMEQLM